MTWTPFTVAAPTGRDLADDSVTYGPGIPRESDLKLLGDVSGARILELGCGAGRNTVALARAGARVIAVDESPDQIAEARVAADEAEVRVELHNVSPAELAFLRADTIDSIVSVGTLEHVTDLGRVFRQIHRVLRTEHPLVFAVTHPTFALVDPGDLDVMRIRRSAFDQSPMVASDSRNGAINRSISDYFVELGRAGFRVDTVLEPSATNDGGLHWSPAMTHLAPTLIIRARKEGN